MPFAPIVLFVYNRPQHTQKTLEALAENEGASESILYIFSDGYKANKPNDKAKIDEVRQVIRQQQWCKEVRIIEQTHNQGLAPSVIQGVTQIINQYGRIIVLEDDLVTAKGFITFMNQALDMYENENQVFGIAGNTYIDDENLPDTYFLPIGTSWGWATWKRAWACFEQDADKLLKRIDTEGVKKSFDFGGFPFYAILEQQVQGIANSWAIRFYASYFFQKGIFLFPKHCLVENIGFGEESTHTKGKNDFTTVIGKEHYVSLIRQEPRVEESIKTLFEKVFKSRTVSKKQRLWASLKRKLSLIINQKSR